MLPALPDVEPGIELVAEAVLDVAAVVITAFVILWRVAIAGAQAMAHFGLDAGHAVEDELGLGVLPRP